MKFNIKRAFFYLLILVFFLGSCKKFIEVNVPVDRMSSGNVYANDYSAISALTAIYIKMAASEFYSGTMSLSYLPELGADNLELFDMGDISLVRYYQNSLSSRSVPPVEYWSWFYEYIYKVNAAIEGLNASTTLTPEVKKRLLGEAQFIRAFYYFYLVNLYGDVPLILSTDYKFNATLSRSPMSKVYDQIIIDLKSAQTLLTDDYLDVTLLKSTTERIRPNKSTVTALLARTYLFIKDYQNAELQASSLVDNNSYYSLTNLDETFIKNSTETIWSLQPVKNGQNTWEAIKFILPATGPSGFYNAYLSEQLIQSFETGDQRLDNWIGNITVGSEKYYYPTKYKVTTGTDVTEYEVVLRLSEQYLVRAEARAQQGKLTGPNSASTDLEAIRSRAGLPVSNAITKEDFLNAILKERQREFFTEWGHRWFDLKRTGEIDNVMNIVCPLKGGTWESYKALYPIPQNEIDVNPGMAGQQNPGYNN